MKKNVHIYLPTGSSVHYATYRIKVNDPLRGIRTVQRNRSTGTNNRQLAQKIANHYREQDIAALHGIDGTQVKLRDNTPTCGQIVDLYLLKCELTSAYEVAQDFLTIVAEGAGILGKDKREKAREIRLSALSQDHMIAFRDQAARKTQGLPITRSKSGIGALMRSGKSIFARGAKEFYRGLALPKNLLEWQGVAHPKEERGACTSFEAIPSDVLARMDRRAGQRFLRLARWCQRHGDERQANRWRNAYAAYWLMRRCGLRNSEVEDLRWDWFEFNGDIKLALVTRAYWQPKATGGRVPVARDLYEKLVSVFGPVRPGADAFVLHGDEQDRFHGSNAVVSNFVRRFLPDREKAAYELRKQYGSEIAAKYGIETAAHLLRHKGIKTAYAHYYTPLKNVVAL